MSGQAVLNGASVEVDGSETILDVCLREGVALPTLCHVEGMIPPNTCRVCVVEVEGSRALVPACSRQVEPGMEIATESPRVRHARKMVFELLATSVDLSLMGDQAKDWMERSNLDLERYSVGDLLDQGSVAQEPKIQDDLYVRDYQKCILCYQCVAACGEQAQNSFAISVVGRGHEASIGTEFDVALPESACVYCGNCIAVCPTGALIPKKEFDIRQAGDWDSEGITVTRTICSFCGIGCNLDLTVLNGEVVRVDSPRDHDVTNGNLCVKGRFGFQQLSGS